MDILAHGLWGAIAAKAINKKGAKSVNPWWTAFWGTFPDLLAFTPLALFIAWNVLFSDATLGNFRNVAPDAYLNPVQYAFRNLTGIFYPLGHSAVAWAVAFGAVWALLRRPAWELSGWLLHIVIDIGTHPTEFYPTRFLWPLSDISVGGIAWATPTFLIVNYAVVLTLLYLLRAHRSVGEGFQSITNTKKTFIVLLAIVAIIGAWSTFQRRAGEQFPHEPASAAVRSQIANTLKQFPTANKVVIGVEGRTEDVLQP